MLAVMKLRHRLLAAALAAVTASASVAPAVVAQPTTRLEAARKSLAALPAADRKLVTEATASLQAMKNARGRFTQTDPNGATSSGAFYLQRPGKIRFEYDAKRPLLVVADGRNVKIYDRALKTFDQYPLSATPLSLFIGRDVRLDSGVVIERVQRRPGGYAITARDATRQAEGKIELVFSGTPARLSEWTVTDPQGQKTRVRLQGLTSVASLDPGLFQLAAPARPAGRR